jgi:hypothetical protein
VPASHAVQAEVEAVVYVPTLQAVHVDAPALASVFVTYPAPHATQAAEDVPVVDGL